MYNILRGRQRLSELILLIESRISVSYLGTAKNAYGSNCYSRVTKAKRETGTTWTGESKLVIIVK